MEKIYKYENATIYVTLSETSDHEELKKATENFLRKVISEVGNNGNCNQSRIIRKEQILDR